MNNKAFKRLLAAASLLSSTQMGKLSKVLETRQSSLDSLRSLRDHEPKICPHCSGRLSRNGLQNQIQRFLCRTCHKSVSSVTLTPLSRVQDKEKLAQFADCMRQGFTLRKTATIMGFTLDRVFRWRHMFLQKVVNHQPSGLVGLVELDETYFRESRKGEHGLAAPRQRGELAALVPVLVGRARGQAYTFDKVLPSMETDDVVNALKGSVDKETTVLCMDGNASLLAAAEELKIVSCTFVASEPMEGNKHVQSVNSYHQRLKNWINNDLRGVATKYLPHYLAWQRLRTWDHKSLTTAGYLASALDHQIINL